MQLNGENRQNVIEREKLEGNGQMDSRVIILKKTLDPMGWSAPTPGAIYMYMCIVYYHNIQGSSSLNRLANQSQTSC